MSKHFPDGELMGDSREVPWEELIAHPVTRVTLRQPEARPRSSWSSSSGGSARGVVCRRLVARGSTSTPRACPRRAPSSSSGGSCASSRSTPSPCGDQRNDLEMLHWAAWGVAMGNAPDQVKAVADEVAGHVDEDGLVAVLRSLVALTRLAGVRAGSRFSRRPCSAPSPSRLSGPAEQRAQVPRDAGELEPGGVDHLGAGADRVQHHRVVRPPRSCSARAARSGAGPRAPPPRRSGASRARGTSRCSRTSCRGRRSR